MCTFATPVPRASGRTRGSGAFKAAGCLGQIDGGRGNGGSTTAGCLGQVHGGGGTGFVVSVLVDNGRRWRLRGDGVNAIGKTSPIVA